MKKILVIFGVVGWLSLPFLCYSVYVNMKDYLAVKTVELIEISKANHLELDDEPLFSTTKELGGITEIYRSRYFVPFFCVWILIGSGLGANFIKKKEHITKT